MRDAGPDPGQIGPLLMQWYDIHARVLPWRVPPAVCHTSAIRNPYHVWLSEVMLQQTTVAAVKDYFLRFISRWPRVQDLAAARDEDVMAEWAGLGYYARARNLLKCARAVAALGDFPNNSNELLALPGIGPYTAAAVAAIAFDEPATVVDGNVERVMSRLFAVETPLPKSKQELTALAELLTPQNRPGDHAQAVMDLGATICTPKSPACGICPVMTECKARSLGIQTELPRKLAKSPKPTRQGTLWLARKNGLWLVETRPAKGLLGGMIGFPGDAWDNHGTGAPMQAEWEEIGEVRHTFTHFHLILRVMQTETNANPERGTYTQLDPDSLPTLMRKAYDLATSES